MILFALCGKKKIKEPANIGKLQLALTKEKFVGKTKYTWTKNQCS